MYKLFPVCVSVCLRGRCLKYGDLNTFLLIIVATVIRTLLNVLLLTSPIHSHSQGFLWIWLYNAIKTVFAALLATQLSIRKTFPTVDFQHSTTSWYTHTLHIYRFHLPFIQFCVNPPATLAQMSIWKGKINLMVSMASRVKLPRTE